MGTERLLEGLWDAEEALADVRRPLSLMEREWVRALLMEAHAVLSGRLVEDGADA